MKLREALSSTFKNRRFWVWQISGAVIYAVPVAVRFATGSNVLPILGLLATPWIDHYVPGNLVEKILVGAFFPGGAGAIAGEVFVTNRSEVTLKRRKKYLARLGGALAWTGAWSLFQLWGNLQNIQGPYGGNVFEYWMVFPLNFLIASLSIFTSDVLNYARSGFRGLRRRLTGKAQKEAETGKN
jgi:hypothetical protein